MVACPQGCASDKADGGENPDKDIFLSPEWMKQIYFISDANYAADAASFYAKSVHDDAGVKGCGLVSAKVEVRQVTRNGPQDYFILGIWNRILCDCCERHAKRKREIGSRSGLDFTDDVGQIQPKDQGRPDLRWEAPSGGFPLQVAALIWARVERLFAFVWMRC